jgi:subtilisin family serine protease
MTKVPTNLNNWISRRLEELAERQLDPVEVAVLDSGIDATHPDMSGRVTAAYHVELSEDEPRIVQSGRLGNADLFGHGTAVTSIITRLAPNSRIVDIRVLGDDAFGSATALLTGLQYAIERKSRVINLSLAAKAEYAPHLWKLSETAYRQNQIIVAAKRNMPLTDQGYPAEFSSCISVDREKFPIPYRLRFRPGQTIEYSAHGEDVVVAAAGGGYTTKTGTSFATPTVSAFCALLVGAHPDLRPFEIKTILKAFSE